jgi:hypothetical protein
MGFGDDFQTFRDETLLSDQLLLETNYFRYRRLCWGCPSAPMWPPLLFCRAAKGRASSGQAARASAPGRRAQGAGRRAPGRRAPGAGARKRTQGTGRRAQGARAQGRGSARRAQGTGRRAQGARARRGAQAHHASRQLIFRSDVSVFRAPGVRICKSRIAESCPFTRDRCPTPSRAQ